MIGRLGFTASALCVACILSSPARADGIVSQVRLGVLAHDPGIAGGVEPGADINAELQFTSPVAKQLLTWAPPWIRWALAPNPTVGGSVNTAGATDEAYLALTWNARLFDDVLRRGDGIDFAVSFGPGFNDGHIHTTDPDRKSLGSNVLFRASLELSYRITPRFDAGVYFSHSSNAGLARYNQSLNDLGVRVGYHF